MRPFASSVLDETDTWTFTLLDLVSNVIKNYNVLKVNVCYEASLTATEPDKLVILWHNQEGSF